MKSQKPRSRVAAALFLITWVTSVGALPLYGGSAADPSAPLAGRASVLGAGVLEVVLAVAVVGTAIAMYPLLRRHGSEWALGYLALRTLEASVILVGVVAILPVVARPGTTGLPGLDDSVARGLHLLHDWTFLVGPGLINPVNATVLVLLLLRKRLVPVVVPILGLVGSVLVGGMNLGVLFGLTAQLPVLALPLFAWEIGLAACLAFVGIPQPAQSDAPRPASPVSL